MRVYELETEIQLNFYWYFLETCDKKSYNKVKCNQMVSDFMGQDMFPQKQSFRNPSVSDLSGFRITIQIRSRGHQNLRRENKFVFLCFSHVWNSSWSGLGIHIRSGLLMCLKLPSCPFHPHQPAAFCLMLVTDPHKGANLTSWSANSEMKCEPCRHRWLDRRQLVSSGPPAAPPRASAFTTKQITGSCAVRIPTIPTLVFFSLPSSADLTLRPPSASCRLGQMWPDAVWH